MIEALLAWEAHRAITDLIHSYAEFVDTADKDGLAALFQHAQVGFLTESGVTRAPAANGQAIAERLFSSNIRYPDGTFRTKHVMSNIRIFLDDAMSARATSYVTVFQATPALPLQPVYAGRYRDAFRSIDGIWQFTQRTMIGDLVGDLSQHVVSGRVPR